MIKGLLRTFRKPINGLSSPLAGYPIWSIMSAGDDNSSSSSCIWTSDGGGSADPFLAWLIPEPEVICKQIVLTTARRWQMNSKCWQFQLHNTIQNKNRDWLDICFCCIKTLFMRIPWYTMAAWPSAVALENCEVNRCKIGIKDHQYLLFSTLALQAGRHNTFPLWVRTRTHHRWS